MWIRKSPREGRRAFLQRVFFVASILFCLPVFTSSAGTKADWESAVLYSRQTGHTSLLVCRGGTILHAEFSQPGGRNTAHPVFSITKALAGLLYLHAIADGVIAPHEPVYQTLVEWKSEPARRAIHVDHLMNMTTGLTSRSPAFYKQPFPDKAKLAAQAPVISPPGRYFAYGPAAPELFALLLERKLKSRGSSLERFLQKRLLGPLGMDASLWTRDGKGELFLSTGARMTPDQMLALGRALLADGRRGFRWIVPRTTWQRFRSRPADSLFYRSGFWFNVNRSLPDAFAMNPESAILQAFPVKEWSRACLSLSAPSDLIAMAGSQGQRIYLIPSERLVIVRTGVGRQFDDRQFLERLRLLFRTL